MAKLLDHKLLDQEVLDERARNLGALNGIKLAFVTLVPAASPTHALLDVEFYNTNELGNILTDVNVNLVPVHTIFPISGGTRLLAGTAPGQVQVTSVATGAANVLRLRVEPIGDYSTYTLQVVYAQIDPVFREIGFKFRPGCFNMNCAPDLAPSAPAPDEPAIDYLAKDYDSFKHLLITAMMERVPGWTPTSEADLDQVLIDLLAADADELSDFQDRVMNEAYLSSARKRLSLARHARLMDYHIHQGNQAGTWLAVKVSNDVTLPEETGFWTGEQWSAPEAVIFASTQVQRCFRHLNAISPYTWNKLVAALEAGSTEAELSLPAPLNPALQADADLFRDLFRGADVRHLLIQEALNPETGTPLGRDITAREIVRLLDGNSAAESVFDPMTGQWFVRVHWRAEDKLRHRYCYLTKCSGQPTIEGVTLFHGNLVPVTHGRPHKTTFRPEGVPLAGPNYSDFERKAEAYYERTQPWPRALNRDGNRWGTLCRLPHSPVAYRNTPPGGEKPVRSTVRVTVSGFAVPWAEQSDLIESPGDQEHVQVETDEYGVSAVRFGNDINGRALPEGAVVTCRYRIGQGTAGNIGADKLTGFDHAAVPELIEAWNPLDVTDGREPEAVEIIRRRVPEAYRKRQLRAVTLEDYVKRAEELPEVSHAAAQYGWTGSWRTVRVTIDPTDTTTLTPAARTRIEDYLNAVRLIGEDLEVRPARYVPLDILLRVCAAPAYWPADLDAVLQAEFSDEYTRDGRPGFFHPDLWTFGQTLHVSQIIGRALSVQGVERVLSVSIRRLHPRGGPSLITVTINPEDVPQLVVEKIEVGATEIIQVANDPSHLETGRINFDILGGRR